MNSTRTALVSSVLTVVLWAAKATAIGIAGGLGKSPLESPLFLLGLVAAVVSAVAFGMALARGRRTLVRVAAGIGGLVALGVLGIPLQALIDRLQPARPGWVWGEVNLWVFAVVLLVAAAVVAGRARVVRGTGEPAMAVSESR